MKPFEVTILCSDSEPSLSLQLDALHWLDAWKEAVGELGLRSLDESDIRCHIRDDGAVEVSLIGESERRFLVKAEVPPEAVTQTRRSMRGRTVQNPSMTIEEMKPVSLEDLPKEPVTRRTTRRVSATFEGQGLYPAVTALEGDRERILRESTEMLAAHIPAERVIFVRTTEERSGWEVMFDTSAEGPSLKGALLPGSSPVPGPVSYVLGRRRFDPPATLTFLSADDRPILIALNSALWCGVRDEGVLQGVFLLLNAPRELGFEQRELDTIQSVSNLLVTRLMVLGI